MVAPPVHDLEGAFQTMVVSEAGTSPPAFSRTSRRRRSCARRAGRRRRRCVALGQARPEFWPRLSQPLQYSYQSYLNTSLSSLITWETPLSWNHFIRLKSPLSARAFIES